MKPQQEWVTDQWKETHGPIRCYKGESRENKHWIEFWTSKRISIVLEEEAVFLFEGLWILGTYVSLSPCTHLIACAVD